MKKICIDESACIGCGACIATDPEHFDFNEDGLSEVINNDNIESELLQNAIEGCPTNAIKISECKKCKCHNCD